MSASIILAGFSGFLKQIAPTGDDDVQRDSAGFIAQARSALKLLLQGRESTPDTAVVKHYIELARVHSQPCAFPLVPSSVMATTGAAADALLRELATPVAFDNSNSQSLIGRLWLEFTSLQLFGDISKVIMKPPPLIGCNVQEVEKDVDAMISNSGSDSTPQPQVVESMRSRVEGDIKTVLKTYRGPATSTIQAAVTAHAALMTQLRGLVGRDDGADTGTGTCAAAGAGAGTSFVATTTTTGRSSAAGAGTHLEVSAGSVQPAGSTAPLLQGHAPAAATEIQVRVLTQSALVPSYGAGTTTKPTTHQTPVPLSKKRPLPGDGGSASAGAGSGSGSGAGAGAGASGTKSATLAIATAKFKDLLAKLKSPEGTIGVESIPSLEGFQYLDYAIGNPRALLAARNSSVGGSIAHVLWKCLLFTFSVASSFPPETPLGMVGRLAMFYVRHFKTPDSKSKLFSASNPFNVVEVSELTKALEAASAKGDSDLVKALNLLSTIVKVQEQFPTFKLLWMPTDSVASRKNAFQAGLVAALVLANGPAGDMSAACQAYLKENSGAAKAHTPPAPVSDRLVLTLETCSTPDMPPLALVEALITQVVKMVRSTIRRRRSNKRNCVSQNTEEGEDRPGAGGRPDNAESFAVEDLPEDDMFE